MKLKKFRAENMAEAMQIIKTEIGPDAVIMSSRQVKKKRGPFGLFSKKEFEVIAGYEEEDVAPKTPAAPIKATAFQSYAKQAAHNAQPSAIHAQPVTQANAPKTAASLQPNPVSGTSFVPTNPPAQNPPIAEPAAFAQKSAQQTQYGQQTVQPQLTTSEIAAFKPAFAAQNNFPGSSPVAEISADESEGEDETMQNEETSLRESVRELRSLVNQFSRKMITNDITMDKRFSRDVLEYYCRMINHCVEEKTAEEICMRAEEIIMNRRASAHDVISNLILETIGKPMVIEPVKYQRKTIMLAGPTGVGKTTTLIKLAYMLVYQMKLDVGVINADSFRVAAKEHLQSYCDILETDMISVYDPDEIVDALDVFKNKDIVLIDTAGKISDDKEYRDDIAKLIDLGNIDDVYITLSAATSDRVLKKTIDNYSYLKKYSIIVTKTDEASADGVFLYLSRISGQPLSYMTTGQNVPDDIKDVNPFRIVESILES